MKKILALVALLGVLLVAGCSSNAGAVQSVDPQAFLQTASQSGVTVIDVRSPGEYAAGHIDGALNIDVEGASFSTEIAALDTNGTYAVYCHSGRRSTLATDAMAQAGFTKVFNLRGGLADLQASGGAVVTS